MDPFQRMLSNFKSDRSGYKPIDEESVPQMRLTIAVDSNGSCPDLCTFVHPNLPSWVSYRYIGFVSVEDLSETLKGDKISHLLILARTNILNLSTYARERREQCGLSVGLWHMADEGIGRDFGKEIIKPYPGFDYVLRNYREFLYKYRNFTFHDRYNMTLRTLGNLTCGTSPPLPEENSDISPRFGVHYVLLDPHELHVMYNHPASSIWPSHLRSTNCSFIGRKAMTHVRIARELMQDTFAKYPELNCSISLHTAGFAAGKKPWDYIREDLQDTKIVLCPRGSAIETHRLTEALAMGSVPALLDAKYLHSFFTELPAIIGQDWDEVAFKMKELIDDEIKGGKKLQTLALQGANFYEDLRTCHRSDMALIFRMIQEYYRKV